MDNNNEQKVLLNKAKELYEAGDADGALKIYEELVALGDPFDMIEAAALLFEKNDPKADKKAFEYVLKASKSTDKAADYLCICYGLGRGTKTSYSEAVRYGEMAMKAVAEDDILPATYLILGQCYAYGKGTQKDLKKGYQLLKLAEQKGLEQEAKGVLEDLCSRYPLDENGEIVLSVRKRSRLATLSIVFFLLTNVALVMGGWNLNLFGLLGISLFSVVTCILLFCWHKWGAYLLMTIPLVAIVSFIYGVTTKQAEWHLLYFLFGFFNIPLSILSLMLLQKRRKGYAIAWNSLINKPDDGRSNYRKALDVFVKYGTGPEFAPNSPQTKTMKIVCYILTAVMAVLALLIAIGFMQKKWDIGIEWNCFKNGVLYVPLCVLGFFAQFFKGNWIHTSYDTYNVYKDQNGNTKKVEKDNDILTHVEGHFLMPIISHLLLIPMAFGAMFYYILMIGFAFIQSLMPYIVGLLVLASAGGVYLLYIRTLNRKHRLLLIGLISFFVLNFYLFLGALAWGSASRVKTEKFDRIPFQKIVQMTSDNVNLRQGPDVNTPRLIFRDGDEYNFEPSIEWSDKPLTSSQAPIRAKYLPVLEESGDWYKASYYDKYYGEYIVYIKKEFCKDVKQKALDFPAPEHFGSFYEVPNGKYKGVVLNWHYGWEDRWIIAIGKRYDDIYVFTHDYNFGTYEDNETDIAFTEWAWLFINERYFNINDSQQRILDLEKLASNEAAMDYIMSNLDKMDSNCELFYAIEGDDLWYCISYK